MKLKIDRENSVKCTIRLLLLTWDRKYFSIKG